MATLINGAFHILLTTDIFPEIGRYEIFLFCKNTKNTEGHF